MDHIVYIGIGSNLGDRLWNCRRAVELLAQYEAMKVVRVSPWYESEAIPVDGGERGPQPWFINGAIEIRTTLSASELLAALQGIEREMGRELPRSKGAPRTIDLDILLYGGAVINEVDLIIPHPELAKRSFVLAPLCDIAPHAVEALSGHSVKQLLQNLEAGFRVQAHTDSNSRLCAVAHIAQAQGRCNASR